MPLTCNACGGSVELVPDGVVDHGPQKYQTGHSGYSIVLRLRCNCSSTNVPTTCIPSIRMNDIPDTWK